MRASPTPKSSPRGNPLGNPFAALIAPQELIAAIERSERLQALHTRVYRPLDKPLIPLRGRALARSLAAFDDSIDNEPEADDMADDTADAAD